jgi:hypothetical protein
MIGVYTSTYLYPPKNIEWLDRLMEYDGITVFTDGFINDPIVDQVKSKLKVAWLMEPPAIHPWLYEDIIKVEDKFDYILTFESNLLKRSPKYIKYFVGQSRIEDDLANFYEKTKHISMISSGKKMSEGHRFRDDVYNVARKYGVDGWGYGLGKPFGHKKEPLIDYQFSICVLNGRIDNYFTEILIDPMRLGTIPILWGCPNVGDIFDLRGMETFSNLEELEYVLKNLKPYKEYLKGAKENFFRCKEFLHTDDYISRILESLIEDRNVDDSISEILESHREVDVSFILSGRDDGYGGDFINRFEIALSKNLDVLDSSGLSYEIIVVDYNPIDGKLLINNSRMKRLLSHKRVKNIIVDRSVLVDDGLPDRAFHEYYAKNIAALKSKGKFLFMTNADIFISKEIADYIKTISDKQDENNFYRFRYRQNYKDGANFSERLDLHSPDDIDGVICGGYSGDATLFPRKVFVEIAKGYDEVNTEHRNPIGQASMDGEILWQLVKNGSKMVLVDLEYYHVFHLRQAKSGGYSREGYNNREGWGFTKYPSRVINNNTIEIYNQ